MRKFCLKVIVFVMVFALCGCAGSTAAAGEELVLAARKAYTALDSAKVEVVNSNTGEAEQTFIFKYDEKGMLTYSYVGVSEGIKLAQYNNGLEQITDDNGEVSYLSSSELRFTAYSREVPYPMADEGLIVFYKKAIIDSKIEENDGITTVTHYYDPQKLGIYEGKGELAGFDVSFHFNADGELIDFNEAADIAVDGVVQTHRYTIYITEQNAVDRVENVVKMPENG